MNSPRIITLFQPLQEVTSHLVEVFDGDPGGLFPGARANGLDQWRVELHAGALRRDVAMHVGPVWLWGGGRWRSLRWEPLPSDHDLVSPSNFLPAFEGEVGLQEDRSTLVLTGSYDPPGGVVGNVADSAVLQRIARATGRRLLADVSEMLQAVPTEAR